MGVQGTSVTTNWVVAVQMQHPGGELPHLFVVINSSRVLVLLVIDFGGKDGFVVDMDGPSIWIKWHGSTTPPAKGVVIQGPPTKVATPTQMCVETIPEGGSASAVPTQNNTFCE